MIDLDDLDAFGPSWSAMSAEERARYGPPAAPMPESELALRYLLEQRRRFPAFALEQGLGALARAAGAPPWIRRIAERFPVDPLGVLDEIDIDRLETARQASEAWVARRDEQRPPGALLAWRAEVAAGVRRIDTLDALWEAAAYEADGRYDRARELLDALEVAAG